MKIPTLYRDNIVADSEKIFGFFGEYRFLSNFYIPEFPAVLPGGFYAVENAYMAAKVKAEYRDKFRSMTPAEAKQRWKEFPLVDKSAAEWDARKYSVMENLCREKFDYRSMRRLLLDTGSRTLIEANWWNDLYWGVDINTGLGENNLGKILMNIRSSL